ncbi:MAG: ACT domain-containing protein, partial [Sulfuricurvum sp.]
KITHLFANHEISIEAVIQRPSETECAHLLFATHEATEKAIHLLMNELEALDAVLESPYMIRIV